LYGSQTASESAAQLVMPFSGTFTTICAYLSSTASSSTTFTLRLNGANTGLSVGIPPSFQGEQSSVNIPFSAFDLISLEITSGPPGAVAYVSVAFT